MKIEIELTLLLTLIFGTRITKIIVSETKDGGCVYYDLLQQKEIKSDSIENDMLDISTIENEQIESLIFKKLVDIRAENVRKFIESNRLKFMVGDKVNVPTWNFSNVEITEIKKSELIGKDILVLETGDEVLENIAYVKSAGQSKITNILNSMNKGESLDKYKY